MESDLIENEPLQSGTQILVMGVGDGGCNALDHMLESNVQGVDFICANTDAQALSRVRARQRLQLGPNGLGVISPEKARDAAKAQEGEIKQLLHGSDMLFIIAGMGGSTGTGAAPVIARIAREMGILTVAVVTRPFGFEQRRMTIALAGLAELQDNVDSLIVLSDSMLDLDDVGEYITRAQVFARANEVLRDTVGGIAEIINVRGHVNVDFEDVRTLMSEPGKPGRAMVGMAQASGPDRARIAAEQALCSPFLEGVPCAKGVLVLITAARDTLKMAESREVLRSIGAYTSHDAHIIYGVAYDDALGKNIRVMVVATRQP